MAILVLLFLSWILGESFCKHLLCLLLESVDEFWSLWIWFIRSTVCLVQHLNDSLPFIRPELSWNKPLQPPFSACCSRCRMVPDMAAGTMFKGAATW